MPISLPKTLVRAALLAYATEAMRRNNIDEIDATDAAVDAQQALLAVAAEAAAASSDDQMRGTSDSNEETPGSEEDNVLAGMLFPALRLENEELEAADREQIGMWSLEKVKSHVEGQMKRWLLEIGLSKRDFVDQLFLAQKPDLAVNTALESYCQNRQDNGAFKQFADAVLNSKGEEFLSAHLQRNLSIKLQVLWSTLLKRGEAFASAQTRVHGALAGQQKITREGALKEMSSAKNAFQKVRLENDQKSTGDIVDRAYRSQLHDTILREQFTSRKAQLAAVGFSDGSASQSSNPTDPKLLARWAGVVAGMDGESQQLKSEGFEVHQAGMNSIIESTTAAFDEINTRVTKEIGRMSQTDRANLAELLGFSTVLEQALKVVQSNAARNGGGRKDVLILTDSQFVLRLISALKNKTWDHWAAIEFAGKRMEVQELFLVIAHQHLYKRLSELANHKSVDKIVASYIPAHAKAKASFAPNVIADLLASETLKNESVGPAVIRCIERLNSEALAAEIDAEIIRKSSRPTPSTIKSPSTLSSQTSSIIPTPAGSPGAGSSRAGSGIGSPQGVSPVITPAIPAVSTPAMSPAMSPMPSPRYDEDLMIQFRIVQKRFLDARDALEHFVKSAVKSGAENGGDGAEPMSAMIAELFEAYGAKLIAEGSTTAAAEHGALAWWAVNYVFAKDGATFNPQNPKSHYPRFLEHLAAVRRADAIPILHDSIRVPLTPDALADVLKDTADLYFAQAVDTSHSGSGSSGSTWSPYDDAKARVLDWWSRYYLDEKHEGYQGILEKLYVEDRRTEINAHHGSHLIQLPLKTGDAHLIIKKKDKTTSDEGFFAIGGFAEFMSAEDAAAVDVAAGAEAALRASPDAPFTAP